MNLENKNSPSQKQPETPEEAQIRMMREMGRHVDVGNEISAGNRAAVRLFNGAYKQTLDDGNHISYQRLVYAENNKTNKNGDPLLEVQDSADGKIWVTSKQELTLAEAQNELKSDLRHAELQKSTAYRIAEQKREERENVTRQDQNKADALRNKIKGT